jgi:uroporphyrinogen decarboxylase
VDYGVTDKWIGNLEGTREYTHRVIEQPEDWGKLALLDPRGGALGQQLQTLQLISDGLNGEVPILHTIFSPLSQAKNLASTDRLHEHLQRAPEALKAGLEIITKNILRYIDAMENSPVAGIFYAIQHASTRVMTEAEYREFGEPYDRRVLSALHKKWWFNMAHIHGDSPMFSLVASYPVQAINWHDRETQPDLRRGKELFAGAVCGGLGRWDYVHNGTPDQVRQQALDAIEQTGGRRFILSTGCVMMITSPFSNIRAVRRVVG